MMLGHLDEGSGSPIVFLHGFTLGRTMWTDACTVAWRASCRSVRPARHGLSSALGEVSPASEVLTSMEALSTMGAVVVGSSLGAAVAIDSRSSARP